MQIVKDTPFEFAYLVSQVRPPRPSLTIIVKGTFKLVPGGTATVADTQEPCHDDVHHDDDDTMSVRLDSDFAVLKPRGECFVAGTCHAPGGRPTEVSGVAFKIGNVSKMLAVFGDRFWNSKLLWNSLTRPVPFTTMSLRYERSFGGAQFEANPYGIGLGEIATASGPARPVPNIENPKALIRAPADRPAPAGGFPIGRLDKSRLAKTGTYDEAWRTTRWPWFPADFDYAYFNAAPVDQQIEGYWRGDEEIVLRNMHAARELFSTRLAGVRARCFLEATDRGWREVAMHLDTITVDADAGAAYCVWRGLTEVTSEKLADIARLYLTHEALEQRTTAPAQRERMQRKIEEQREEDDGFAPETPPALPTPPSPAGPPAAAIALPAVDGLPAVAAAATPELDSDASAASNLRDEVTAGLARGESFKGRDLTGANLANLDLAGADFSGAILSGARMTEAKLEGANLDGASLSSADLSRANLRRCSLKSADLAGMTAPGADFEGATLDGASFVQARLTNSIFKTSSCLRTEFGEADLSNADFRDSKLDRADFGRAKLDGANFTAATMVDTTVEGVSALRVNMDRCDLTKLRASEGARFTGASFRQAKAPGSRWGTSNVDRADFTEAVLDGADFSNASLAETKLNGCKLKRARFQEANLTRASLLRADAFEGMFEAADLTEADLRGGNFFGAEFWRARTDGARMETAILTRTKLA